MKTRILSVAVVAIAASMAMSSCNRNEAPAEYDGAVRFTSGITATPTSRVSMDKDGNSVWDKDDQVGIYMVENAQAAVVGNAANIPYKAKTGAATTAFAPAGAAIYYPLDETAKVDFIAYHPYSAAVANFVYPVDLSAQTSQTAIDLMYAHANNQGNGYTKEDGRNQTAVNFTFSHQLAKLVLNVTKDASVTGDITAVSIKGMNTTAKFDLTGANGLTEPGTPKAIAPYAVVAGSKYEAILLPVTFTDAHIVTFTVGGEDYNWKMNTSQIPNLATGKVYTYDITITKHEVNATGEIAPWKTGGTGSGIAD